jgi:hypothetical protein
MQEEDNYKSVIIMLSHAIEAHCVNICCNSIEINSMQLGISCNMISY